MVLADLIDEADAFENVRNIVDSSLLNLEVDDGLVEVELLLGGALEQVDELLGQLYETVLFPASSIPIAHVDPILVRPVPLIATVVATCIVHSGVPDLLLLGLVWH